MNKIPVAVIAATGAVGQRFISLLADHPWFEVAVVTASERSAGKTYAEAVKWLLPGDVPAGVQKLTVQPTEPVEALLKALEGTALIFSALPSDVAKAVEPHLTQAGHIIASNASALRMVADVPVLIPEINAEHLQLVEAQRARLGGRGFAVTMSNCALVSAIFPLKALNDAFGVSEAQIVTMQAISGAGYPGVPSFDILDNVIPFIGGEEEKIESETLKILGRLEDGQVTPADIRISAQANRVPVMDGHLAAFSVKLGQKASLGDVMEALRSFEPPAEVLRLPSAPQQPLIVREEADRPQPRRDREASGGMAVSVGRVRPCPVYDYKMVGFSHNTIRGAAGGAVLAGEWIAANGYLGQEAAPSTAELEPAASR